MAEDSQKDEVNKGSAAKPTHQGVCGTTLPTITVVGIIGNLATVVGVVIMNKYIQKHHGLNAMIFLSFCHFVTTTIGIRILLLVGFFRYKAAQTRAVAPVRSCGTQYPGIRFTGAHAGRARFSRLSGIYESKSRTQFSRLLPDI